MDRLFYDDFEEITDEDRVLDQVLIQRHLGTYVLGSHKISPLLDNESLCVLRGLQYSTAGGLNFNVSNGALVFNNLTTNPDDSGLRIAYRNSPFSSMHNPANPTLYRWDLIEATFTPANQNENRNFRQTIGTFVRFVTRSTLKRIRWNVTIRVRSGTDASIINARLPQWDPSGLWVPLAMARIDPGNTIGSVIDLRLLLGDIQDVDHGPENVQVHTRAQIFISKGSVNFASPRLPAKLNMWGSIPPAFGGSNEIASTGQIIASPGLLPLSRNVPYYLYAVRPTTKCGHVAALLSNIPPHSNQGLQGVPTSNSELPPPWPTGTIGRETTDFVYLTTITGFLAKSIGLTWAPNGIRKTNREVVIYGKNQDDNEPDAFLPNNLYFAANAPKSVPIAIETSPSIMGGSPYVAPPTATSIRVLIEAWGGPITVLGQPEIRTYTTATNTITDCISSVASIRPDTTGFVHLQYEVEIPLDSNPSSNLSRFWIEIVDVDTGNIGLSIKALGYKERY